MPSASSSPSQAPDRSRGSRGSAPSEADLSRPRTTSMLDLAITARTQSLRLSLLQAYVSDARIRTKTLLWHLRHRQLFPQGDWSVRPNVIRSEANRKMVTGVRSVHHAGVAFVHCTKIRRTRLGKLFLKHDRFNDHNVRADHRLLWEFVSFCLQRK
jgi:hypothetical protein